MKPHFTANTLTPENYTDYRHARFGPAGRFGSDGASKAGKHHGVGARSWLYYESGDRTPPRSEREKIARWLNARGRIHPSVDDLKEG